MDGDLFSDLMGGTKPKDPPSSAKSVDLPGETSSPTITLDKEELKQLISSSINSALESTFGNFVKSIRTVLEDMGKKIEANSASVTEVRESLDLLRDVVDAQSENYHCRFTSVDMSIREVDRGVQAIRDKAELQEAQAQLAKLAGGKEVVKSSSGAETAAAPAAAAAPAPAPVPAPAPAPAPTPSPAAAPVYSAPPVAPAPAPPVPMAASMPAAPAPQYPQQMPQAAPMMLQQPGQGLPPQQAPQSYGPPSSQYSAQPQQMPMPGPGGPGQSPSGTTFPPPQNFPPQQATSSPMGLPAGALPYAQPQHFQPPAAPYAYPQRSPSYNQPSMGGYAPPPGPQQMYPGSNGGPTSGGMTGGPGAGPGHYRQNSNSSSSARSQGPPPSEGSKTTSRSVPLEQVITDISHMGFDRGQINAVITSLQRNGQSVDLNVILDKLTRGDYS
eukprot:gene24544-10152_t